MALLQVYSQPSPFETVARTIREDVPAEADAILATLDPDPAASASIGQVHRARRRDGTPVAVKVRHPGIADAIRADFRTASIGKAMSALMAPGANIKETIAEARARFLEECDYGLEDAVGFAIFDRSGHRAVLTPAGAAFLAEARALLGRADELSRYAEQLGRGWEPELALVVDGVLPLGPVMRALNRLSREAVPTRVEVVVEYLGGVHERFASHRADFMLALDFPGHPDYDSAPMEPVTM